MSLECHCNLLLSNDAIWDKQMDDHIDIASRVLYEDDTILLIHKPAGLMVEPDRNNHPNLLQYVKRYLSGRQTSNSEVYVQHLHRLDRPVSGIILFCKDRNHLRNLSEQFAERIVRKEYQALTYCKPANPTGRLLHWHRKEKKKAALYTEEIEFSEQAYLDYKCLDSNDSPYTQWQIELHTGKYHQIRAQLASIGCPILGDTLYGSTEPYLENSIALHAHKLSFKHPKTGQKMTITCNPEFFK